MQQFQDLKQQAEYKLHVADHIITQTFPSVKDPKLLIAGLENIFLAYSYSMGALLSYERLFKRIPNFQDTFEAKVRTLRILADRYSIKQEDINTIKEIRDILLKHKESPMEFPRNDRFIICSEDYEFKTIDYDHMRQWLSQAK